MGVDDRGGRGVVFLAGQQFLEAGADLVEPGAELAGGIGEGAREASPTDIAGEDRLFFFCRRPPFGSQRFDEFDCREVVVGLGAGPALFGERPWCYDVVSALDVGIGRAFPVPPFVPRSSGGSR